MTSDSNRDAMSQLYTAIQSSKGMAFINLTYTRSFSLNIFVGNTRDFIALHRDFANVELYLDEMKRRDDAAETHRFREVNRLFHNFLAGAMTLVDRTGVLVSDRYLGTEVNKEFKAHVDRDFASNPLTRLVQDLRNYMAHRGMPPVLKSIMLANPSQEKGATSNASSGVFLSIEDLRKWGGWKADSKKFLDSMESDISLLNLAEDYRRSILSFHQTFDKLLRDHHARDLDALKAMQATFREYEAEGGLSFDDAGAERGIG